MQINKWPPPPEVDVIAKVDGAWIEGRRDKYGRFEPIFLNSHGCGCCSSDDPTPTHWIAMPVEGDG